MLDLPIIVLAVSERSTFWGCLLDIVGYGKHDNYVYVVK